MEPWTRRVRIRWRPSLEFFEHRYAILRDLESAELLRQFRVLDDQVSVRLGDARHLLTFGTDRIDLAALTPKPELGRLRTSAQIVWERLNPSLVGRATVSFQWLEPLNRSYDEARRAAGERVFPMPEAVIHEDLALSFDSLARDGSARLHMEAGIVEAAEIPPRLARMHRPSRRDPEIPPTIWPVEALPAVALFCDQEWDLDKRGQSVDDVFDIWEQYEQQGREVMLALHKLLIGEGE